MDFNLTENQVSFQEAARDFAVKELTPHAARWDREKAFPRDAIRKARKDVRALIVSGAGEKAFVAGADIKEMAAMSPREAKDFALKGQAAFNAIEALPFAVIAAVNGFALGGGCELALACDIILASEKAKFGLPEVTLGLLPSFGGTQRLARSVGLFKAREMIFSGGFYPAAECQKIGLVNRVTPPERLFSEARELAETISKRGPVAVAKAKQAVNSGFDRLLGEGLAQEASLFGELFSTQDQKEGTSAFIEKRSPDFKGLYLSIHRFIPLIQNLIA